MLMEMDVAYIRALKKKGDEEDKATEAKSSVYGEVITARPLTPQLFDALFANNDNARRD